MDGRFPSNRVLSHDLIEGCYARSGVVNDVELFEGCPSRFLADMGRRHRWIRGDWQIASWLCKRVPTARGTAGNPLDGLARWKIFDNLRRSLVPPLIVAFLVSGWTMVPRLAGLWTLLALLLACGQPLAACLIGLARKPEEKPWRLHAKDQGVRLGKLLAAEAFAWCVLPYVACRNADAVARTCCRLRVSRRRLLEWTTSSDAEAACPHSWRDHWAVMWPCWATALAVGGFLMAAAPEALRSAGPALLAWLAGAPWAWWISRPRRRPDTSARSVPQRQVRRWARQTWHYFETFVNEQENWLPPDNVQEHSPATIVTRTSPTNIGMSLLAGLAAHDLGYLTSTGLIERTRSARASDAPHGDAAADTSTTGTIPRTLQPLGPRYVSSVDSGNLWGR